MPSERFRRLIRGLRVGVIVQDRNSKILLSNPAARELLGLSEEQMLSRTSYDPGWEITREDGTAYPAEERPVAIAVATRRAVRNVVMCVRRPRMNDRVWLLASVEPELNPDGSVRELVSTLVDITDRKRLEDALLQAQKLESIGRLAGGVAHDFNNMLAVIVGSLDLALVKLAPDHPVVPELRESLNAAERAGALTKQLLLFARKQATSPQVISVTATLQEMAELIRRVIAENIALVLELNSTEPVRMDPTQLEQIVLNLVVNARDAMPKGGTLSIGTEDVVLEGPAPESHFVRIQVSDTGEGIAPALLSQIFEPFFTTKGIGLGTGLGLATVRSIVHEHKGRINVESRLGGGTTFTVFLRSCQASLTRASLRDSAVAVGGDETVLVAEDEAAVRSVAVRVLRDHGYTVLEASDGEHALQVARSHVGPIHLVVTDIVMPKLDGRALVALLRNERPLVRAVFVSGYAEGELSIDAGHLLAKPYRIDELARTVRAALDE